MTLMLLSYAVVLVSPSKAEAQKPLGAVPDAADPCFSVLS